MYSTPNFNITSIQVVDSVAGTLVHHRMVPSSLVLSHVATVAIKMGQLAHVNYFPKFALVPTWSQPVNFISFSCSPQLLF